MESIGESQGASEKPYEGYVILSIGEGGGNTGSFDKPISKTSKNVAEKITGGATYISLEKLQEYAGLLGDGAAPPFEELLEKHIDRVKQSRNQERRFVIGDVNELPIRNNSIDEVWMENVFSDPNAWVGWRAIEEISRALKRGGTLFVLETCTPSYAVYLTELDIEEQLGLSRTVYRGDALVQKLSELGFRDNISLELNHGRGTKEEPFLIIFKKVK